VSVAQALILGLIQGLSEFLPVSSSAHLTLAPWLFGWPDPGLAFDVALHVGTLVAVLAFFQAQWIALIAAAWNIVVRRRVETEEERRVIFLIVATIPGAIAGLALEKYAESTFRDPKLIAIVLIVMGIVLWAVDRVAPQARPLAAMRWTDALWMETLFERDPWKKLGDAMIHDRVSGAPYGLGIFISTSPDGPLYWHPGGFPGYHTDVAYSPTLGVGVAFQTNCSCSAVNGQRAISQLLDVARGLLIETTSPHS